MAENNPILSVISKFQSFFNLPTNPTNKPIINNNNNNNDSVVVISEKKTEEKPVVAVRMPRGQAEIPSLRLEDDQQCPDHNTNPVVLWQVYAIGGFFVVRWVLARLNERRNKRKPSDDEEPSPNDD